VSSWPSEGARMVHRVGMPDPDNRRERIVFMASRQIVYQCLSHAAERQLRAFDVCFIDKLPSQVDPENRTRLVLIGGDLNLHTEFLEQCTRRFPGAGLGVMVDEASDIDPEILQRGLIKGVLPLSLPLDVWLAIVQLLLSGGEYLPENMPAGAGSSSLNGPIPGNLQAASALHPELILKSASSQAGAPWRERPPTPELDTNIALLTARERQILQLVSEGFQNKLIANRMALSEHTVKAHVHNLIAKLHVTNRTQAAAAFLYGRREGLAGGDGPAPALPLGR
jgi:DNA-binding NarL/FixJ family response regulator